jgi:hypothetical protein
MKMDDDRIDFYADFPLWFLRNTIHGNLMGGLLAPNQRSVFLFTDEDLAERFVANRPKVADVFAAESVDRPDFIDFLNAAEQAGFTHVALDPGPTRSICGSISKMRSRFEGRDE